MSIHPLIHILLLIRGQVGGAFTKAEILRLTSSQAPPPTYPGEYQGIPRPAGRRDLSSVS